MHPTKTILIILEGTFSSGKSTLTNMIFDSFGHQNISRVKEHTSLQALYKAVRYEKKSALDYFKNEIVTAQDEGKGLIVFDRLHISAVVRSLISEDDFFSLEKWMKTSFSPQLLHLHFAQVTCLERIKATSAHRPKGWRKFLKQIWIKRRCMPSEYFQQDQTRIAHWVSKSTLDVTSIDTTANNYHEIMENLFNDINSVQEPLP